MCGALTETPLSLCTLEPPSRSSSIPLHMIHFITSYLEIRSLSATIPHSCRLRITTGAVQPAEENPHLNSITRVLPPALLLTPPDTDRDAALTLLGLTLTPLCLPGQNSV
jgi:hypothetical protein